jgi:GntR family transcriptional regulator
MIAQYHLYPVLVNENYSVKEITDTKICRQLDVKKNYPSFFVKRTTFDCNNNIIEYAETYFNKDFYSTTVNIRKD